MINDGYQTFFAGWGLQMAGEFSENWAMMSAGTSVMRIGDAETYYWWWWANDVIGGGVSSDGVVPGWSQQGWPNVLPELIGNEFHTAETGGLAAQLRSRLNELFGH